MKLDITCITTYKVRFVEAFWIIPSVLSPTSLCTEFIPTTAIWFATLPKPTSRIKCLLRTNPRPLAVFVWGMKSNTNIPTFTIAHVDILGNGCKMICVIFRWYGDHFSSKSLTMGDWIFQSFTLLNYYPISGCLNHYTLYRHQR